MPLLPAYCLSDLSLSRVRPPLQKLGTVYQPIGRKEQDPRPSHNLAPNSTNLARTSKTVVPVAANVTSSLVTALRPPRGEVTQENAANNGSAIVGRQGAPESTGERSMRMPKIRTLSAMLIIAAGLAAPVASRAALVNLTYDLDLDGMSSGTCPNGVCGTVKVTGDTTSSLKFEVDLAQGVFFHANHAANSGTGNFFFFDLTGPSAITFSGIGVDGTIGTKNYSFNTPASGAFGPNPGNFPGLYDFAVSCTNNTAGKVCDDPLTFTANGGSAATPFVIGAPLGHGLFPKDNIAFVADLSISGQCGDFACTAGTGFVGASTFTPAVPEPSTWAMMLLGFAGLGFAGYRRGRKGSISALA